MKHFTIIMGGAGVGKNYYIEHTDRFKDFTLIDIDVFKRQGEGAAMFLLQKALKQAFISGVNVVHPTVGGTVPGNVNKLKLAKHHGYTTEVIFLRGSPEKGIANVAKRVESGGHSVPNAKIEITYERAEKAFWEISDEADEWNILLK